MMNKMIKKLGLITFNILISVIVGFFVYWAFMDLSKVLGGILAILVCMATYFTMWKGINGEFK